MLRRCWPPPLTSSTAAASRTAQMSSRWKRRLSFNSQSYGACARPRCSALRTCSRARSVSGSTLMRSSRSESSWAKPPGRRLLADRQALLRPRDRLVAGRERLAERRDVACNLVEPRGQLLVLLAAADGCSHGREVLHALLDPVERVLDRLEALADRPQAPGQALDV